MFAFDGSFQSIKQFGDFRFTLLRNSNQNATVEQFGREGFGRGVYLNSEQTLSIILAHIFEHFLHVPMYLLAIIGQPLDALMSGDILRSSWCVILYHQSTKNRI